MGESQEEALRLGFDARVRLEFVGSKISSDAGLVAYRELDEKLGLTAMAGEFLAEQRSGRNVQHHLVPLLRQSIYSRLAGYPDTNDADRLARDPTMRLVVSRRASDRQGAARNTVGRFETEILSAQSNREGLAALNAAWVSAAMAHTKTQRLILDLDSSESPVHGQQEGARYNGHYGSVCYHPLFRFNQFGDCEGAVLREGNVSSADGWRELLDPIVKRYAESGLRKQFRGDAGFARPEIYEYLEEHDFLYAIRLPGNAVLDRMIEPCLTRPETVEPGDPVVTYHDLLYQAGTWDCPRRVVSKIEWHAGELFPRVGFIVTNRTDPPKGIVRFFNGRGTCEQWIKEGKHGLGWVRLSCHQFKDNAVRLALFVLAYNLGNFLRRLVLPKEMARWSLTSLRERLVKIGARLTRHARRLVVQMAEVAITGELFAQILTRIRLLSPVPTW
jgi:Transposase DDE domain group 1